MTTDSFDAYEDHDPLSSGVDGTPFSVILSRAAKLKTLQLAEFRSKYDSFPEFYRNTMFSQDDIKLIRTQSCQTQIDYANALNEEGRQAFIRNDFCLAYSKYEVTLSIFRYLHNKNSNWRNEGIKDIDIEEFSFQSDNEEEMKVIHSLCLKCYINIAVTALKMEWYKVALDACNSVLTMDNRNVKALFLRCKVRTVPKFSNSSDLQLALQDLDYAIKIDPGNISIRREIIKLQSDIIQKKKMYKKMCKGLFTQDHLVSDGLYLREHRISDRDHQRDSSNCKLYSTICNNFEASSRTSSLNAVIRRLRIMRPIFQLEKYLDLIRSGTVKIQSSMSQLYSLLSACLAMVCSFLFPSAVALKAK